MGNWIEETQLAKDIDQHEPTDEEKAKIEARTREEELQAKCRRLNAQNGELDKNIYNCSICNNKGFVYQVEHIKETTQTGETIEDDYLTCKECKCQKIRETIFKIKESGITEQMFKCTFENYDVTAEWQKEIKNKAVEFVNSTARTFYIGGMTGSGKTHICTAIVGEFIKKGLSVRYLCWYDFLSKLKSNLELCDENTNEMQTTDVLYIDDLFKFTPTDFEKQILYKIIDYRVRNNLITIISSENKFINRTAEAIKKPDMVSIDLAIARRIELLSDNGKFIVSIANEKKFLYRK